MFALFTMAYYFPIMSYALYYVYLIATHSTTIFTCSNAWNTINCTLAYNYSCLPNTTASSINMTTNIITTATPTTQASTIMTSTLMANISNASMVTPLSPLLTCPQYRSLQSSLPEAEFFR